MDAERFGKTTAYSKLQIGTPANDGSGREGSSLSMIEIFATPGFVFVVLRNRDRIQSLFKRDRATQVSVECQWALNRAGAARAVSIVPDDLGAVGALENAQQALSIAIGHRCPEDGRSSAIRAGWDRSARRLDRRRM